jgi:hypothetical protein
MAPTLDDLAHLFQTQTLPKAGWTHEAHLRVGAWYVDRFGAAGALPRLREGIRRLNDAHGTANTTTGGYHETITAAYVALIAAFLAAADPELALAAKIDAMLASPLGDRAVLLRFWSKDRLMAAEARAAWVEPDLAPLQLKAAARSAP